MLFGKCAARSVILLAAFAAAVPSAWSAASESAVPAEIARAARRWRVDLKDVVISVGPLDGARSPKEAAARKPRYALHADRADRPASTAKLVTTLVALEELGASWRWKTTFYAAGRPDAEGRLKGPLYLRGTGDPTLVVEDYALELRRLAAIGVKHIREFDSVCFRNKVKGIYISKSGFSRDAVNLAEEVKIKLMDFGDICRLGDDVGTNVYHFAVEPPRMLDGKDIHSVKMVFDIAGPANFDVRVDGFEEYYECSKKSPLTITMHDGKHTLYFKSKGYKEVSLDVDLTDDVNVYVRQNWGLKGGLKYELEE